MLHRYSTFNIQDIFYFHQLLHSSQPGTRLFWSFKPILFYAVNHFWVVDIIFPRSRSLLPVTASSEFAFIISSRRWHSLRDGSQSWVLRGDRRRRNARRERQTLTPMKAPNELRNEGRWGRVKTLWAKLSVSRSVMQSKILSPSRSASFSWHSFYLSKHPGIGTWKAQRCSIACCLSKAMK